MTNSVLVEPAILVSYSRLRFGDGQQDALIFEVFGAILAVHTAIMFREVNEIDAVFRHQAIILAVHDRID
jgi:hypothetical protein